LNRFRRCSDSKNRWSDTPNNAQVDAEVKPKNTKTAATIAAVCIGAFGVANWDVIAIAIDQPLGFTH
jgi:hypothetical protein